MRLAVIACGIFKGTLPRAAQGLPGERHIFYLRQGLHNTPSRLQARLQRLLNLLDRYNTHCPSARRFDAAVLVYGRCSNGICGVRAGGIPLVIPRAHDCFGIFLGSKERYDRLFRMEGGAYWFNAAWYEQAVLPSPAQLEEAHASYAARYGTENADYLIAQEWETLRRYRRAVYVSGAPDDPHWSAKAKEAARGFGWSYSETAGDLSMLSRLLSGSWAESEVLVLPPHTEIAPNEDGDIIQLAHIDPPSREK